MSDQPALPDAYLSLEEGREAIFSQSSNGPSKRTWAEWRLRGYFPVLKVGKRVFVNPVDAKAALERRFKINAIEAK